MARRLLASKGALAVYDTRDEAMHALSSEGATPCNSPAEVADRAQIVFVSLPSPEAVLAVATGPEGLIEGRSIRTYIDLSTTGPSMAETVRQRLAGKNIGYLDAPVSGGLSRAESGGLTIMASGTLDLFNELGPLLHCLGENIYHVGDTPGQGQLTKVINNLLSATSIAITAEAVALGVKGGLDPGRLLTVINASSGRNTATADKFPRYVLTRTFDYGFRLGLMTKDVDLCLDEAGRRKVPMILGGVVKQIWDLASNTMESDVDSTAIVRMVEQWSGVTIEASANVDEL